MIKMTLPMCPPLNSLYRHGKRGVYKIAKARAWENEVCYACPKVKTLKGDLSMTVWLYLKRDRDIDGSLKLLLDVGEKAGWYENDRQVVELNVTKETDKDNSRLEIIVEEL